MIIKQRGKRTDKIGISDNSKKTLHFKKILKNKVDLKNT